MELKEQVETLQKDIAQLTELMKEKAQKDLMSEVKELSDKLVEVQKELRERKIQFETASKSAVEGDKIKLATAMDELFIAKHLCVNRETGNLDPVAWDKVKAVYADQIKEFGDLNPNTTGSVENYIPVGFSSQFDEEIFLALQVAALFGRIKMPQADYKLPFVPGRTIAKAGTEGGTVAKTKPGSERISFTAKKLMSIVELTDELDQDALIPVLNLFRKQLIDGFALAQDAMALNGGAATLDSGAFAADDCRTLVAGIRSDALTMGRKWDCGANVGDNKKIGTEAIRGLRASLGKYGVSPSELAIICSIADYNNLLNEQNYQTLYQYGPNAVILRGELGKIDGIPIVVSELCPDGALVDSADAPAGVISNGLTDLETLENNTFSTFTLVNTTGYKWGDRKEFNLEMWRNPLYGSNNLIGTQRLDFRKITGANSTPCGVGHNYTN